MKKLILLLLIFTSCSKDEIYLSESTPVENNDHWTFYYRDTCGSEEVKSFCVNEHDYENAMLNPVFINEYCFSIRIKDLDGNLAWRVWHGAINICNE